MRLFDYSAKVYTDYSQKELMRGALRMANRVRKFLGLQPVDVLYGGKRSDPYACAITNTVYDDDLDRKRYSVTTSGAAVSIVDRVEHSEKIYALTPLGRHFVSAFDDSWFDESLYETNTRVKL